MNEVLSPEKVSSCCTEHGCSSNQHATSEYRRDTPKIGRNDACPCESGRKFKKCCGKSA